MTRKASVCAVCENSNLASICAICVNYRLNEYNNSLKSLKAHRDSLYAALSEVLVAKNPAILSFNSINIFVHNVHKGKADDQTNWRVLQHEKLTRLREKLRLSKEQLVKGRAKIESMSVDLKLKYGVLESALSTLEKNRVEQLEKFYPNLICTQILGHRAITAERLHKQSVVIKQICKLFPQRRVVIEGEKNDGSTGQYDQICNARLPRALDPHSVPSEELSAALGYMVQLLRLVVHNLAAPALHNSGFAGSCSRIWQRDSYWDARPSSRSNEYPLFIPRQNYCSASGENSWSDRSSCNFGVASMESERRPRLDSSGNNSFNYASASSHSIQTHKDLQKGISLLKKSVACITAYCYNSLSLDVPSELSTFEAFAKLLAILSSSKEVRSVLSSKMARSRSCKQAQQLNKSVWNVNSAISSTTLLESSHSVSSTKIENYLPSSAASFLYATDLSDGKSESLIEEWDLVEHPTFPPPPSQSEDVEHWTRAMFIDAKKK
ncbi:UV radiation resistance protein/autophagy-related protein 14 [Senna tora]|uniref:UV radiation resistance protein/autophagy-related protein 14 n=1 Tax=Senna tora TaxID=362788 RepID=A0A834T7Z3_9FABA|nr:UV radiation resistance protein/autophagy-related protein 14 [Senna tora]